MATCFRTPCSQPRIRSYWSLVLGSSLTCGSFCGLLFDRTEPFFRSSDLEGFVSEPSDQQLEYSYCFKSKREWCYDSFCSYVYWWVILTQIAIAESFQLFLLLLQLSSNIIYFKLAWVSRFMLRVLFPPLWFHMFWTIQYVEKCLITGNWFSWRKGNFHLKHGVYTWEFW